VRADEEARIAMSCVMGVRSRSKFDCAASARWLSDTTLIWRRCGVWSEQSNARLLSSIQWGLGSRRQSCFDLVSELEEVVIVGEVAYTLCRDSLSVTSRAGGEATELAVQRPSAPERAQRSALQYP